MKKMELLKTTEDHEQFIFQGKPINTIEVLISILKESTDEQFSHHTDDERNDFASWVEHVFNNKDVADKLNEEKTREGTIKILEEEINKRKTATEPVLQENETVMNSEPKEKPEETTETTKEQSETQVTEETTTDDDNEITKVTEDSANLIENTEKTPTTDDDNEITKVTEDSANLLENTEKTPTTEEIPVKEETTESVSEDVSETTDNVPPQTEEVQPLVINEESNTSKTDVEKESTDANENSEETLKEEENNISDRNSKEEEKDDEIKPLIVDDESKEEDKSVLTPMNDEGANQVKKNIAQHHFCPWKFDCTKKEFMYGLFIGILIGFIGMKIINLMIS